MKVATERKPLTDQRQHADHDRPSNVRVVACLVCQVPGKIALVSIVRNCKGNTCPVRSSTPSQYRIGNDRDQSRTSQPIELTDPRAAHKVDSPDHILQTSQAGIERKTLIKINIEKKSVQVNDRHVRYTSRRAKGHLAPENVCS